MVVLESAEFFNHFNVRWIAGGRSHATGARPVVQCVVERLLRFHHLFAGKFKWEICVGNELSDINHQYSAFANSCPLQTDTFLFPLIHSHHALLSSNKFQQCNGLINTMYGVPPQGHLQGNSRFVKQNRFAFGHVLVEILQMYSVHKVPHRAQVSSTFYNEIAMKVRQETVVNISINTHFACSKRLRTLHGFLRFAFSRRSENVLWFHEFSRTSRSTKIEKLS